MKKSKRILQISLVFAMLFAISSYAQSPPHPPGHEATGNVSGGGAPIGGGLLILLGMGAAYGARKIFQLRKENIQD